MPELPEVEVTKNALQSSVFGEKITSFSVYNRGLRWPITGEKSVVGSTICGLVRRGKYLIFELDNDAWIMVHLGMSGSLRVTAPSSDLQKHEHWSMQLTNQQQVRYNDTRRFGCLLFGSEQEEWQQHSLITHLGVEPLQAGFHGEYLYQKLCNRRLSIKQALMDSKVVAGIGNIYTNEALFFSGIHPQHPSRSLTLAQYKKLTSCIKEILHGAITEGKRALGYYRYKEEEIGYFQQQLSVYNREGSPCKRSGCSGIIERCFLAQRSSFYCPQCQIF